MKYKPNIEDVLKRYKAFWQKEVYDRPPIRVRYPVPGQSDEDWPTASQTPETYYPYWENVYRQRMEFFDDDVCSASVDMGPGFMGGVMGCPVYFDHGTSWSDHCLTDWADLDTLKSVRFDEGNQWIKRLREMIELFKAEGAGKCLVGVAMLTGPGDIMTALRGPTKICMDFYEFPDNVRKLAEICTQAWIAVQQFQMDLIDPLDGGYCDNYSIWTPGRSTYFADDISVLLSPKVYRDNLFDFDCRIAESLETPWMHVHSGGAYLVPEFLKIPGLVAIQIVNDHPAGPTLKEIVPILKRIQKNHCLLLRKYPMNELEEVLPEFSPEGLYIDTQADSLAEAQQILSRWENKTW
jgi:hypothetical protein